MHTLEENTVSKVLSAVDSVITTVETKVRAVLTTRESLVIPRVDLAMKSINASSGHGVGSVVLDPDQRGCSGNIEGLQMIASIRLNSHRDLNRIDETLGITNVDGDDLLVIGRNIDRQTHTHHNDSLMTIP